MQPTRRHGLGAADRRTGETAVIARDRERRREVAELLETLPAERSQGRVCVAWGNAGTREDEEVEAVPRGAAGRLVLLHLLTYSPWLNPIEVLWRHFRREATHCELFDDIEALLEATRDFFNRIDRKPGRAPPSSARTPHDL